MDYKNFIKRILSSLFLIIIYLFIFFINSDNLIYFVSILYFIILIEIVAYFNHLKKLIVTYILFSFAFLIAYFYFSFNPYQFTFIILCIGCFDSSCYLSGKLFGKKKLFSTISPNKTYEGLIGGILITNLIIIIINFNLNISNYDFEYNLIFLSNLIIFFSFFGDLIQSYFKRINNLKDSSNYIPGHGGFFDRFDSFLLVIIPLCFIKIF